MYVAYEMDTVTSEGSIRAMLPFCTSTEHAKSDEVTRNSLSLGGASALGCRGSALCSARGAAELDTAGCLGSVRSKIWHASDQFCCRLNSGCMVFMNSLKSLSLLAMGMTSMS